MKESGLHKGRKSKLPDLKSDEGECKLQIDLPMYMYKSSEAVNE